MTNFVEEAYKLHLAGDAMGAHVLYMAALDLDPKSMPALMNLSQLAMDENHHAVAEVLMKKAIAIDPNSTVLWGNLGMLLSQLERFEEADHALTNALNLGPELTSNWRNAGLLRIRERRYDAAVECFKKVISLGDDGHGVRNDLAHAYLALGELKKALELYESRWSILHHHEPWDFHTPEWKGENLNGKNILVSAEQGFGDTIMTMRFLTDLRSQYPHCHYTFCVPKELVRLCNFNEIPTISFGDVTSELMTKFDYHTPLMSMVRWLGIEVSDIKKDPYLDFTDTRVKNMTRIGICWASGRRNTDHDWRGRYTKLEDWLPLAEVGTLISLQQGPDSLDIERLGAGPLISESEIAGCSDFYDTAKLVASLDVVVSVDTAVVHLAGAMGKFVIMLSQYSNCWRWWQIEDGYGGPWYNDVHIVRQAEPKDWKGCLRQAKSMLEGAFS